MRTLGIHENVTDCGGPVRERQLVLAIAERAQRRMAPPHLTASGGRTSSMILRRAERLISGRSVHGSPLGSAVEVLRTLRLSQCVLVTLSGW